MNNTRYRLNKRGLSVPNAFLPDSQVSNIEDNPIPTVISPFEEDDIANTLTKKVDALKRCYPDEFEKYNPVTDKVDLNNPRDDGWLEFKQAEILARKEVLKCMETLKAVRDTAPIKRDRLRAATAIIEFAEGQPLNTETKPTKKYNVNLLIQVLTGNK